MKLTTILVTMIKNWITTVTCYSEYDYEFEIDSDNESYGSLYREERLDMDVEWYVDNVPGYSTPSETQIVLGNPRAHERTLISLPS